MIDWDNKNKKITCMRINRFRIENMSAEGRHNFRQNRMQYEHLLRNGPTIYISFCEISMSPAGKLIFCNSCLVIVVHCSKPSIVKFHYVDEIMGQKYSNILNHLKAYFSHQDVCIFFSEVGNRVMSQSIFFTKKEYLIP